MVIFDLDKPFDDILRHCGKEPTTELMNKVLIKLHVKLKYVL